MRNRVDVGPFAARGRDRLERLAAAAHTRACTRACARAQAARP